MISCQAYPSFPGTCEEALNFYAKALGGKIPVMPHNAGSPMESRVPPANYCKPVHGFSVTLNLDTPENADRIFSVLCEDGSIGMDSQEPFWARRFGMRTDWFGTPWMVNCEKPM